MQQPERWLFVSDVDDTLLGDDSGLVELMQALQTVPQAIITAYNSSRPCASLRKSLAEHPHLSTPDYLIGALGTEIQNGITGEGLTGYVEHLSTDWDRDAICALIDPLNFIPHPAEFQTALKVSYTLPDESAYEDVRRLMHEAGLKAKLIFSGASYLDVIPSHAGKGNVIGYLAQHLKIDLEHVVVAGDSGNDIDMFVPPFKGVVVGNADPGLKQLQANHIYHAHRYHAGGVLEGLQFWKVLS